MPVVFDNTFLALLFGPFKSPPVDVRTGKPVQHATERIDFLIETLARGQVRILIPTPALCEFLSLAERAGSDYLARLHGTSRFQIIPFDTAAAVEAARAIAVSLRRGDKRGGRKVSTPWAKVKFDRQIVAIAITRGATEIFSDDEDIAAFGLDAGIQVTGVAELPLPPPKQENLPLGES